MIYLDSAATYPVLPWAKQAFEMAPFGNPSSEHAAGRAAREALEDARARIAQCIGADADEVYFCSGATEACNWAIESMRRSMGRILSNLFEHRAVAEPYANIRKCKGKGPLEKTGTIQMLANNETGEICDIPARSIPEDLIFSDATAAVGHIPVDFHKLGVDYMAFAAHKFGGIPGIGALVVKKGALLSPMFRGGGQERGKRGGTESVALASAMAAALEWQTYRMYENECKLRQLRDLLWNEIVKIPRMHVNTPLYRKVVPHILNVSFDGVNGHALACMLSERYGIMVSAGAACSSGKQEPSRVLMAMFHGDRQRAAGGVRISLSIDNTQDDCEQAAKAIVECVGILREIS